MVGLVKLTLHKGCALFSAPGCSLHEGCFQFKVPSTARIFTRASRVQGLPQALGLMQSVWSGSGAQSESSLVEQ